MRQINEKMNEYYKTHTLKETAIKFKVSVGTVKNYTENKKVKMTLKEIRAKRVIAVTKRRKKLKRLLVAFKGGKCMKCGYNKSYAALQFHHREPKNKSFGLSLGGLTRSLEILRKEANKCDLLCANCHAELHGSQ